MIEERQGSRARPLWIIAFLILVGGYIFVTARYETRIRREVTETQSNYEQMRSNRHRIIAASRFAAMRNELNGELKGIRESASVPVNVGNLLSDLERKARANSCQLLDVVPAAAAEDLRHTKALRLSKEEAGSLEGLGFDLTIRGGYRNILRFVAQIPRGRSLLEVSRMQMNLGADGQTDAARPPLLDATLHIILYSLRPGGAGEGVQ